MKSSSNQRPAIIERVAPNRHRYNYNIREVEREEQMQDGKTETRTAYDYDYVEFGGQPDRATITRLIIREEKSETQEFELVNRYNAVMLDIEDDETAINDYKAWLNRVAEIKAMVAADLEAYAAA